MTSMGFETGIVSKSLIPAYENLSIDSLQRLKFLVRLSRSTSRLDLLGVFSGFSHVLFKRRLPSPVCCRLRDSSNDLTHFFA